MMKKASLYILLGAVALVAVVAGWLGWSMKAEDKASTESSMDKAREARAALKVLRIEAEELGIDHYGLSAKDLKEKIENFKSQEHGDSKSKSEDKTDNPEIED